MAPFNARSPEVPSATLAAETGPVTANDVLSVRAKAPVVLNPASVATALPLPSAAEPALPVSVVAGRWYRPPG